MDFDFTTKEGIQKFIVTLVGILATVLTSVFGISPDKTNVFVSILTQFAPLIAVVIYYFVNQYAAKGKAATAQKALETKTAMIEELAVVAPDVAKVALTGISVPLDEYDSYEEALSVPKDWPAFKEDIKRQIDENLAERIRLGQIEGVYSPNATAQDARNLRPILSSDNPSMIWSRTQLVAMDTEIESNQEAIDFYENALLPAAQNALVDQQGTVLSSGKTCTWPPSFMAQQWVNWCLSNIANLKKINGKYNFTGYKAWEAGEIATGFVEKRIPLKVEYVNGVEKKTYFEG